MKPGMTWLRLAAFAVGAAGISVAQEHQTATFGVTVVNMSGLRGSVYLIRECYALPQFEKLKPSGTLYTAELNIPPRAFTEGFPGITRCFEWFAIDYKGRFWIEKPGVYAFDLLSDDGSKLYIDGSLVIDNDGLHSPKSEHGIAELAAGLHQIRVSYFQGPRFDIALVLTVAPPGEPSRVFSTNEFKPPADSDAWKLADPAGDDPQPKKHRKH